QSGIKELCELLGRMREAEHSIRQERVKCMETIIEHVPDANSKEEVMGVKLGRDIEHALPQELALIADPDLSVLFDMKYLEGRLMSFDMQGIAARKKALDIEKKIDINEKEGMGPMIICVDTSGSMQGTPETIAKAITLFMASHAIKQKRKCLLINFSTNIDVLDLSGGIGMKSILEFLRMSFYGGTDVGPALRYGLNMMKKEAYKKADLLVISDFIMKSLPEDVCDSIQAAKGNGNQFYSLAIGNLFLEKRMRAVFDNEWVYNPRNKNVHALISMINSL
ncbi:MAG: VWA domain-containing protein, partial [Mariprofundaceae bacterium]|nr:VWA domain-containing protein [Mariprofundaceae bacterium]